MGKRKEKETRGKAQRKPRRDYRRKQKSASIYFLIWAAFSAFALVIIFIFALTQRFVIEDTYDREAAREVNEKGRQIEAAVKDPPEGSENMSFYLRVLSNEYDVGIVILDNEGTVICPQAPAFGGEESGENRPDFSQKVIALKEKLAEKGSSNVVYEGDGEYVYGAVMNTSGETYYLYVSRSLELVNTVARQINARTTLVSVFVLVLAFAVSSAVSGWLTKPITEMTKKAKQFAAGDFEVDFHGEEYGAEMVELAEAFNFARDELSKTDAMQRELIANVSHDFKTPLTMIKTYACMIAEISGNDPVKREKHAKVIIDETDRLTSLVADVLDLSKIRSGLDTLQRRTFNMSAYLYDILERFEYLAATGGYKFVAEIEPNLYTQADDLKIGQAIYNLIGNAVNYTGEDKTVYVRLKKTAEKTFRFSVTDTGEGIPENERANIWNRYYRSAQAHKRPVQGTGLGLSIVKAVLEKHKLVFGVESEPNKGSTFYVDFPSVDSDKDEKEE